MQLVVPIARLQSGCWNRCESKNKNDAKLRVKDGSLQTQPQGEEMRKVTGPLCNGSYKREQRDFRSWETVWTGLRKVAATGPAMSTSTSSLKKGRWPLAVSPLFISCFLYSVARMSTDEINSSRVQIRLLIAESCTDYYKYM